MPASSSLASAKPFRGELALRVHTPSPGALLEREPISPELVLVDPELAQRARTLLSESVTVPVAPKPSPRPPSGAQERAGGGRRSVRLAAVTASCLLLVGAVTGIAIRSAGSKHGAVSPSAPEGQAPTTAVRLPKRKVADVLMPIRPGPVLQSVLRRFGPAPVQAASGQRCLMTWPGAGLRLTLVAPRRACAKGTLVGVAMWGRDWKTGADLRIGDGMPRLRRLYPRAIRRQNGWWRLHKGGSRVPAGGLFAHVNHGRVDEFWVE